MGTAASVTKTTTMPSDGATVDAVDWSTKIGNAVQKITLDNLLGNMTMGFTQDERLENEKVEASQKSTGSFVIAHNFYGFPTKASKQNVRNANARRDRIGQDLSLLCADFIDPPHPFVGILLQCSPHRIYLDYSYRCRLIRCLHCGLKLTLPNLKKLLTNKMIPPAVSKQ